MKKSFVFRSLAMAFFVLVGCVAVNASVALAPYGQFENQAWNAKYFYALIGENGPVNDWYTADFDDTSWSTIQGPISFVEQWESYPALSFIGTVWSANNSSYWIRRHFTVEDLNDSFKFFVIHDDECTAYLNGVQIYNSTSALQVPNYNTVVLQGDALNALHQGDNVLAVYVSDSGGGQALLDFGLYGNDFETIVSSSDVPIKFFNDSIHPWGIEENTAIIRGNDEHNYYASSWLKMSFTTNKRAEFSFEWASYDYGCHDGLQLYIDGVYQSYNYNNSTYASENCYLEAGEHIIAFRDSANYYNYSRNWSGVRNIKLKEIEQLDINVAVPGSMGDSILAKVENFADVLSLKLRGKLNDDDIYTLKNRLTSLYELDLSELDWIAIPDNQFSGKTDLYRVILPNNVESIGNNAFYNCQYLKPIVFPNTLKNIGEYAFYRTYSIGDVVLPEGLISMGSLAFCESGLTSVSFPSTLQTINYRSFGNCSNLQEVHLNGQTSLGPQVFYGCSNLKSVKFPETMISTEHEVFWNCTNLKEIELNENLKSLGSGIFSQCKSLTEITIPSTVLNLNDGPFRYCDNLKVVKCLNIVPPSLVSSPTWNGSRPTFFVPRLSLNVYKQTNYYDDYDIQPIDVMPDNIVIDRDYKLNWPDSLNINYKPNVYLRDWGSERYGSLTVNGNSTLSAGLFSIEYDPNITREYHCYDMWDTYTHNRFAFTSLINNANVRADHVEIEYWLRANSWEFVSFPFDVKVGDIREAFEGTPFVIRKYDGQKRAEGLTNETWVNMTADSTLHAGQGYIWRSASTDNNRNYTGFYLEALQTVNKNNIFANDNIEVDLAYYESEFAHNRSWNLIGNPYPCFYDIRAMLTSAPITIWDTYQNNYRAFSPDDDAYVLNPGQAFFVQRPVDEESITFLKEGRQTNLTVRDVTYNKASSRVSSTIERNVFNVIINNGDKSDRTRFVINSSAKVDYESARDASKFMAMENPVLQLYTMNGDVRYSINERPLGEGIIKLGMQITEEGMYTMSLDTKVENEVFLIDHLTGTEVRLDGNSYNFHSEAGTFETRFSIRLGSGDVTGIKTIDKAAVTNDVYYDMSGRLISEPQKGVYVKNGKKVVVK